MTINRDNYEQFLVDYADGLLSPLEQKQVEAFLLRNPDIAAEFEQFAQADVLAPPGHEAPKAALYAIAIDNVPANTEPFEQWCVQRLEGQLNPEQIAAFNQTVATDAHKKEVWQWFEKTILPITDFRYDETVLLYQSPINQPITPNNITGYCIALMEGWLDTQGQTTLNAYLETNPWARGELRAVYQTRLTPDLSVTFAQKSLLKRGLWLVSVKQNLGRLSAAAAIAAFVGMWWMLSQTPLTSLTSSVVTPVIEPAKTELPQAIPAKPSLPEQALVMAATSKPQSSQNTPVSRQTEASTRPVTRLEIATIAPRTPVLETEAGNKLQPEVVALPQTTQNQSVNNIPKKESSTPDGNAGLADPVIKNLANQGLTTLSKVTDGAIKVNSKPDGKKRLAITTRYFALETSIKNR